MKIGDKVRTIRPFVQIGTVTYIDEETINMRPKYSRYDVICGRNEVKLITKLEFKLLKKIIWSENI